MANKEIETFGWGSPHSTASLYGSALRVEASGAAQLVNHLMPAGTTIQEWYSFTDYQLSWDTPVLPLLHHGKTYRLVLDVDSVPEDAFVFEVQYVDRFNDLVGTQVLYPPDFEFDYPVDCHHYTIRLINGGCDELRFTSMTLVEVEEEVEVNEEVKEEQDA